MNIIQIKTLYEKSDSMRQKSGLTCGAISVDQIGGKQHKTITIREVDDPTRIYCVDFYLFGCGLGYFCLAFFARDYCPGYVCTKNHSTNQCKYINFCHENIPMFL